jgi:hypothetical protein
MVCGIAIGVVVGQNRTVLAQGDSMGAAPAHYSVIETQGTNLLVTDNHANRLYFYTVDRGAAVGSPLKLRGSVDLNQVGQPSITPRKAQ